MPFEMHIDPEYLGKIKDGTKTIELRLYDEKRRCLSLSKHMLLFINRQNVEDRVAASIKHLHIFPTFKELFEDSGLFEKCGFDGLSPDKALQVMYKYYSPEDEKKYGVVGIELCDITVRKGYGSTQNNSRQDPHQGN